jgi:hypothetical protein
MKAFEAGVTNSEDGKGLGHLLHCLLQVWVGWIKHGVSFVRSDNKPMRVYASAC